MADEYDHFTLDKHDNSFSRIKGRRIKAELEIHLGWETFEEGEQDFDLDLSAFLVTKQGKVPGHNKYYCVFYHNHRSEDGSTIHRKHDEQGGDPEDREIIAVHLDNVTDEVHKIVFVVSIYDAEALGQTFGKMKSATISLSGDVGGDGVLVEIVRDHFETRHGNDTAVVIGEIYRATKTSWEYKRIDHAYPSLTEVGRVYGVEFK